MQVWITHPGLTPAHDQKVDEGAFTTWSRSGWQMRADQSDPVEAIPDADDADETAPAEAPAEHSPADDTDPPASGPEPSTTKKKGEV